MSPDERMRLLEQFASVFSARVVQGPDDPILVFDPPLTEARFRGLQRALRGRYLRAWLGDDVR